MDVLLLAGAATAAATGVGGALWWFVRPRFVELVRSAVREELHDVRDVANRNATRIASLESSVGAMQEGLSWSGRMVDRLADQLDNIVHGRKPP